MDYKRKRAVVRTSLLALGVAFETVSKRSAEMKAELADWEEGQVFALGVLPDGPEIALRKEGDRIRYLGRGDHGASLKILFKNMDCAFLPMAAKIGSDTAYVQHRAILHGNVGQAMQLSRAMRLAQTYLMPDSILRRIFKRAPKLTFKQRLLRVWVMSTVGLGMLAKARK